MKRIKALKPKYYPVESIKYSLCQMIIDRILFRGRIAPPSEYCSLITTGLSEEIKDKLFTECRKWATYSNISAEHALFYYYASLFKNNIYPKYELKFFHLKKILKNPFLDEKTRDRFMVLFASFQKTYWGFSRLVRLWKVKKASIRINTDLYMGVIEPSDKYTFTLLQNKNIYYFALHDLKQLFLNSLSHHYNFTGSPLPLKNPYNNVVLSKSDLYNIYFKMKHSGFPIHRFIESYFRMNFNIYRFQATHANDVREYNICEYARHLSIDDKIQFLFEMISIFDGGYRLKIHPQYPNEKIVDALGGFLKPYLLYRFTLNLTNKNRYEEHLTRKMKEFIMYNPFFGSLKHKRPKKGGIPVPLEYHNKNEIVQRDIYDTFISSHIYNDARYNRMMYSGRNSREANERVAYNDIFTGSDTESEESAYESDSDEEIIR